MMADTVSPGGHEAVRWRFFLRALATELDTEGDPERRDDLLRRVGARVALGSALPSVSTLEDLEAEINEALLDLGWGRAHLALDEPNRVIRISHSGLPSLGSLKGPNGPWLSAALEGLYTVWLGQQSPADRDLLARRGPLQPGGEILLIYGRGEAGGR